MYHLLAFALAPLLYPNAVHAQQSACGLTNAISNLPQSLTSSLDISVQFNVSVQVHVTQNFTCSSGTYVAINSHVELYDHSCQQSSQSSNSNPSSNGDHSRIGCYYAIPDSMNNNLTRYVTDPTCGTMSSFEIFLTESVTVSTMPAPNPSQDYPWTAVKGTHGSQEYIWYQYDTQGGQPPAQCQTESETITVDFTATVDIYEITSSSQSYGGSASTAAMYYSTSAYPSSVSNGKAAAVIDAAVSTDTSSSSNSDSDNNDKIQKLLNYAPAVIGLLLAATMLSFTALVVSFVYICRRRGGTRTSTRSVPVYHPVQLPRSSQPMMEDMEKYHDETKPYGI